MEIQAAMAIGKQAIKAASYVKNKVSNPKPKPKNNRARKKRKSLPRTTEKTVAAPVSLGNNVRNKTARITPTTGGGIRVRHIEMFDSIRGATSATAFAVHGYDVTPASNLMFPWLSQIAENYEQYKFHNLVVRFVSKCPTGGNAGTDTGTSYMAIDYDSLDASPQSPVQIRSYQNCSEATLWLNNTMSLIKKEPNMRGWLFCHNNNPGAADIRLSQLGIFYFCNLGSGIDSTKFIGDVSVSYDVEFMTPHRNLGADSNVGGHLDGQTFVNTEQFPGISVNNDGAESYGISTVFEGTHNCLRIAGVGVYNVFTLTVGTVLTATVGWAISTVPLGAGTGLIKDSRSIVNAAATIRYTNQIIQVFTAPLYIFGLCTATTTTLNEVFVAGYPGPADISRFFRYREIELEKDDIRSKFERQQKHKAMIGFELLD